MQKKILQIILIGACLGLSLGFESVHAAHKKGTQPPPESPEPPPPPTVYKVWH